MNGTEFADIVTRAVGELDDLTSHQSLVIIDAIRKKFKELRNAVRASVVMTFGKCLTCGTSINYVNPLTGKLAVPHERYGDGWLVEVQNEIAKGITLSVKDGTGRHGGFSIRVNGHMFHELRPYLCGVCRDSLEDSVTTTRTWVKWERNNEKEAYENTEEYRAEMARLEEEKRRKEDAYIKEQLEDSWSDFCTQDSTPKDRYLAICRYMNLDEGAYAEKLRNMPYAEFLITPYWKVVRQRKLHLSGYRCELCSAKNGLNVHHKTYDNHGVEHDHMEDLIVLCLECHAKFHDKVGMGRAGTLGK